jgi:hypothetical protein
LCYQGESKNLEGAGISKQLVTSLGGGEKQLKGGMGVEHHFSSTQARRQGLIN